MSDWCDDLTLGATSSQISGLRAAWELSVPQLALLLGVHHSSVYRWEKATKPPIIERGSRRVLAVLHVLRDDKDAHARVGQLLRQGRDIEALHFIFMAATAHQAVLEGKQLVPALPGTARVAELARDARMARGEGPPGVRMQSPSEWARGVLRDEEDEGERVDENEPAEEADDAVVPPIVADCALEVFMLGRWCDYGRHTQARAETMAQAHRSRGRQARVVAVG